MRVWRWFRDDFFGIVREMRWSYVPPLMVYLAAGISGFTGIIESFYVKEELGLTAEFLAGLGFWAGLPWALKMPLGHLVDLFWRQKALFVYLGAALMAVSLLIMIGLTGHPDIMTRYLEAGLWYVIASLLSPVGFVLQDVVADAMTVEAVPTHDEDGREIAEEIIKRMHITMQTLGRIAIIGGSALVAGLGGWLAMTLSYKVMYQYALIIPVISILGVSLGALSTPRTITPPQAVGRWRVGTAGFFRRPRPELVYTRGQRRLCRAQSAAWHLRSGCQERGHFPRFPGGDRLPDAHHTQGS